MATPAIRVAIGIADCLTPNESPCRCLGTCRASDRLDESCPSEFPAAPTIMISSRLRYEPANAAMASMDAADNSTPARLVNLSP